MTFRLVESGWDSELANALTVDHSQLRIICPFIKERVVERLLKNVKPESIRVITRFNLSNFYDGVSDTAALRLLLSNGAQVRGVKDLHAKLYLFGTSISVVTSANLTDAALLRNYELGIISKDEGMIVTSNKYFNNLWEKAGPDLSKSRLQEWEERLDTVRARGTRPSIALNLSDEGENVTVTETELFFPPLFQEPTQAFVKFFGTSESRADRNTLIRDEVKDSCSHWACPYPKQPRQVQDGAVMFIGKMVKDPNDILIIGRAIGMKHVKERDYASAIDIEECPWKAHWPYYVRVHHAEFLNGTLSNGISLKYLMENLKHNSFDSTQRNYSSGTGNVIPQLSCRQQPAVMLSKDGFNWLNAQLERAFITHGKLSSEELDQLGRPSF